MRLSDKESRSITVRMSIKTLIKAIYYLRTSREVPNFGIQSALWENQNSRSTRELAIALDQWASNYFGSDDGLETLVRSSLDHAELKFKRST